MIFFVVGLAFTSCNQEEVAPMQEVQDVEMTDGDDDDEDCGQAGGGCPGNT